jgi:hypothetical protein
MSPEEREEQPELDTLHRGTHRRPGGICSGFDANLGAEGDSAAKKSRCVLATGFRAWVGEIHFLI